jgi:hypothetical protein
MQTMHFCEICRAKISNYGYPCNALMDLVCSHYLQNKTLTINYREIHDRLLKIPLEYMEKKGFIISTEISKDSLQILPNIPKKDLESPQNGFCWC